MKTHPLTPALIVHEALAQLAEGGLEAVTLRKVAARLNVQAMSLYWHIKDKDELYCLMCEALLGNCVSKVPACTTWGEWLRAFGREVWRAQHEVRDAARLVLSARHSREGLQRIADSVMAPLEAFGLSRDAAMKMQSSVQALVVGWNGMDQAFGDQLSEFYSIEATMLESLDAMIAGWEGAQASARSKESES